MHHVSNKNLAQPDNAKPLSYIVLFTKLLIH